MRPHRHGGLTPASAPQLARWITLFSALGSLAASRIPAQGAPSAPAHAPPAQEGIVTLGDANIEYFSQGTGAPIVLLPFGGLTVGYMAPLSQALADAGYRVVRINFRGSGKSTGSANDITLHTFAADVAGVITALRLGPTNVGGHAFGNRVARMLAADHPELARTVILFAAGGKVPATPHGQEALKVIFSATSTDSAIRANVQYMVGDPKSVPLAWELIKPCRAPQVGGMQGAAMANTPLTEWWAPPGQMPYLVLQGSLDQIAVPENGELLKQEMGSRVTLVQFPGEGHLFLATHPAETAAAVVAFLH